MHSENIATIEGFITDIPEFNKTRSGKTFLKFQLCFKQYRTTENELPATSFIHIELWEELAIRYCDLKKGDRIMVQGSLRQDRWEDEKGHICSRLKLIVISMINSGVTI